MIFSVYLFTYLSFYLLIHFYLFIYFYLFAYLFKIKTRTRWFIANKSVRRGALCGIPVIG